MTGEFEVNYRASQEMTREHDAGADDVDGLADTLPEGLDGGSSERDHEVRREYGEEAHRDLVLGEPPPCLGGGKSSPVCDKSCLDC